ncbi:MAG: rhomboid family intramembrane serine protease [Lacunisphaera sp.]|nr:rhomboid family intramembrane serine protease [Lacunisphaera sp.]
MLSDRSYMRDDYAPRTTSILTWILCALVSGFVLQNIAGLDLVRSRLGSNVVETLFALTPLGLREWHVWTLVTYTLLHANILHILFNGLGLYMLGRELLPLLGSRRFLTVMVAAAVTGAILWLATRYLVGGGTLIGVSASVMALFILFACFYPEREITFLLFFVLPVTIKPKYLAWILLGVDLFGFLFSELPGKGSDLGIAYSAHLGGMLAGWVYYRYFHANHGWDRAASIELPAWLRWRKPAKSPGTGSKGNLAQPTTHLRAEVDRILDKINSDGFGALTEDEKRILDEAKDLLSRH